MTTRYNIERLSSPEQLRGLEDEWDALLEGLPQCALFLSWAWLSAWWDNFHNGNELWLLTARDGEGKLAGLAPLMCSRHKGGIMTLRRLSFLGAGIANPAYLDFPAREQEDESLATAFLQYLYAHAKQWDILDLQALREGSPLRAQILAARGGWLEREPTRCPFVSLPSSWETFQDKYMNRKLRKTIRYYERRLEKDFPGKVIIRSPATAAELDRALDFLIEARRSMPDQAEAANSFANEDYCRFSRDIAHKAFRHGFLRFYQLVVDDRIIAVQHCFNFKGIFYGYQTAYDPDWGKYSPGQQLLVHVFREAVREKANEVDMSPGESDYKARWESDARFVRHLLYARGQRARLWLFGLRTYEMFLKLGRKLLPIEVRRKIGRFLGTDLSKSDLFGQR